MFEERKLLKLMEKDCEERRERNLQRLKEMHPELFPAVEKSENKKFNKKWFGLIIPTVSVATGLAIVLPIVLVGNNAVVPPQPNDRYCSLSEYSLVQVDETIEQFNENSGECYNYFDWYDISEDILSCQYIDNTSEDILGLSESMYNTELEICVELCATPKNIHLEDLEAKKNNCSNENIVNGNKVLWEKNDNQTYGVVEYDNYRYYVTLIYSNDENQLFTLIEELLQ